MKKLESGCACEIAGESLHLLPERALYWPRTRSLLIADLHLGKAGHFRRNGIAVPGQVMAHDLQRLGDLLERWQPERLVFLGDLFHSTYNREWEFFADFLGSMAPPCIELILGNHDVLPEAHYQALDFHLYREGRLDPPFFFSHHPLDAEKLPAKGYALAGHLHPGLRLQGKGRQSLRLPCFWLGSQQGVLPAFGSFTGLAQVEPQASDQLFVIVEEQVVGVG
jgi:uncharacterized protein